MRRNSYTPTTSIPIPHPNSNAGESYNSNSNSNSPLHINDNPLTLNLDTHGKPLTYASAKSGPDKILWTIAEAEEITRLIISGTIVPVLFSNIPRDRLRDVVYYNPVVKQKYNTDGSIKYRVRGTAGGNSLQVPYDVSARTASLDVVKLLIHSVISDKKKWFTIDIKDFYLGTPLPAERHGMGFGVRGNQA